MLPESEQARMRKFTAEDVGKLTEIINNKSGQNRVG